MQKFDHFNFLGPVYDLVFHGNPNSKIIELLELNPNLSILDVGGGTGRISAILRDISPHVTLVDSAFSMLKIAKEKDILTVLATAENLPFNRNSFDRIIMVDAFHHVADHQQTVYEMWRLLKPGGKLIIEEPDIKRCFVKVLAIFEKLLFMRSHFVDPDFIADMFKFAKESKSEIVRINKTAWIIIEK